MKADLTPRQVEVLQHLAAGKQRKQVAAALGVTSHTVKTHTTDICFRLGANNAVHAVAIAMRQGVLQ